MAPSRVAIAWLVAAACAAGCGDDSEQPGVVVLGPPSLAITSPTYNACVVLGVAPELALTTTISVSNWTLRPPGACAIQQPQCGYVAYAVDGQPLAKSAATTTDVPLSSLPEPTGTHTLVAELRSDTGEPVRDSDGGVLRAEVTIRTVLSAAECDGADASVDAQPDAEAPDAADDVLEAEAPDAADDVLEAEVPDAADNVLDADAPDAGDDALEAEAPDADQDAGVEDAEPDAG